MNDIQFNLIDEPWVRVMDRNCCVKDVSLKEAILNAHEFKELKGELPTQDVAIMRLLLAVIHTVVSRYDCEGGRAPLTDNKKDAMRRWSRYWNRGAFSNKAFEKYFEEWYERFWLFHPDRPFFQVAELKNGTDYGAPKLNGEISESNNKTRLFSAYSKKKKKYLSYSQAARWLLYLNAYDDTSGKPTKEGKQKAGGKLPSAGAGWLGQLGLINITGENLFETLMLNLVMINNNKVQCSQKPLWENAVVMNSERVEIVMPDNLAELYTLQSRRIFLDKDGESVTGYKLIGGDFFEKHNAFFEPMTVWRKPKKDKDPYSPKRHDSSRQMWREFSVLYNEEKTSGGNERPGVINWYCNYLYGYGLLADDRIMNVTITAVEYGDKDFFVKNVFSDSLSMHSKLLTKLGENWRNIITSEIAKCENVAYYIGKLAQNLYVASGGSNSPKDKHYNEIVAQTKEQLYYRLDVPFREWLRRINPDSDGAEKNNTINEWQLTTKTIIEAYANELFEAVPEMAFVGHKVSDKVNKKTVIFSAPQAINMFRRSLNKIYERK